MTAIRIRTVARHDVGGAATMTALLAQVQMAPEVRAALESQARERDRRARELADAIKAGRRMSIDEARGLLRFADSYSRLGTIVKFHPLMERLDWFRLFGEEWSSCDNIGINARVLRRHFLADATDTELAAMMDDADRAAHTALPASVTIYRGCYSHNRDGLSWSLDRGIAAGFPFLHRYQHAGEPLLLIGTTPRHRAVLKLDREEQEVIAPHVTVLDSHKLTTATGSATRKTKQET